MLSMKNVGGSSDAGKYYEQADDYYTKDQSPSLWQGKAAKVLGLNGEVVIDQFKELLDGNLPNGVHIHVPGQGRRGGTDLTFSAPKSVSMQALIGRDQRLIDAHDQAVSKALAYGESLIAYRQTEQGKTKTVHSGNMLAATFRHELSRACDPQLHTHSVILNLTQTKDKQWRAIDNELLYRDKMLMGALYRAELAREAQNLGYEVKRLSEDGLFELAHFTKNQLKKFSERSQVIEEAVAASKGLDQSKQVQGENSKIRDQATAREKEIIALATRPKKTGVDRKTLHQYWQEKSHEAKISYKTPHQPTGFQQKCPAKESVNYALEHTTERQAVVQKHEILRAALQHGVGRSTFREIQRELNRKEKNSQLLRHQDRFTTPQAQEREKEILKIEKQGRGTSTPIVTKDDLFLKLKSRGLNMDQQDAAAFILSTKNPIIGIQGIAGSGKTRTLQAVRELAGAEGYHLKGLAPSTGATAELIKKSGIPSQNLAAFERTQDKQLNHKTLLVVDEAGMVSAKQMQKVLKATQQSKAKVLLSGDTQQLKAVEAGTPFEQLQKNGMATAWIRENLRQKNPLLKQAVQQAFQGKIYESTKLIQKEIHEIKKSEHRYESIAKDYIKLSKQERKNTLVVSGTNEARKAINQEIRKRLNLAGQGKILSILERKDFTQAQIKQAENYQKGDLIKPHRDYRSMGLKNGELCQVVAVREKYLIIEKPNKGQIRWEPHRHAKFSAYQIEAREITQGDKIRITENDHNKKLINGEIGKVQGFENGQMQIQKKDGETMSLDTSKPLHLEYGYCSTVHAAQGQDRKRVLIDVDTKSLATAQDNYYVAISRAERELKIYTNDKEKLPEAVGRENVKKAALEVDGGSIRRKQNVTRPELSKKINLKHKQMDLER